jgi:ABC-type uncharacterized transport system fused permease/ATPase subunit
VLDEATSAMSDEFVEEAYRRCRDQGTTLITIAHDERLAKLHNWRLRLGVADDSTGEIAAGRGTGWSLEKL